MNDISEQRNEDDVPTVSFERLYSTMAEEADGFYKQMITICTAFLGGSLVFSEKLFVSDARWSLVLLFVAWLALTYPLAVLVWVRWQNVEAHRHALKYLTTHDVNEYQQAQSIPIKGRKWTTSAIILMVFGLFLIASFTAISIYFKYFGGGS